MHFTSVLSILIESFLHHHVPLTKCCLIFLPPMLWLVQYASDVCLKWFLFDYFFCLVESFFSVSFWRRACRRSQSTPFFFVDWHENDERKKGHLNKEWTNPLKLSYWAPKVLFWLWIVTEYTYTSLMQLNVCYKLVSETGSKGSMDTKQKR